jgi:hypothetical protein
VKNSLRDLDMLPPDEFVGGSYGKAQVAWTLLRIRRFVPPRAT